MASQSVPSGQTEQFDYIIIGAGSAGALLGDRLSAEKGGRVLLLEAGGKDSSLNLHIPAAFFKNFKQKEDWDYQTVPQKHANRRRFYLPRGKVLGGSGSINAMIYIRGNRQDYNSWAEMGNRGWSYDEVLPYFKKSEKQEHIHDTYHGSKGKLPISNQRYTNRLSYCFLEAIKEVGYGLNSDFNGKEQEGFGLYQVFQKRGQRSSTVQQFLKPAMRRSNLVVRPESWVHKVLIEEGRAVGVQYRRGDKVLQALATKEVILSAGAYNSPQILMLSGIGDAAELGRHNIEMKKNLPGVGKNLQDHFSFLLSFHCTKGASLDRIEDPPAVFKNLLNYFIFRRGPFVSNIGEAGGFFKSFPQQAQPDLQVHFGPAYFINHGLVRLAGSGYSIGPQLLLPQSRGTVTLASDQPEQKPLIDHNYLAAEADLEKMVLAFQICQEIGMAKAFSQYRTRMHLPQRPLKEREEIMEHIRNFSETLYHPVGTCKMGSNSDAVVNEKLEVHGIDRLRVVDASIMPTIVRGNTNAPTIMIAEKGADMILGKSAVDQDQ